MIKTDHSLLKLIIRSGLFIFISFLNFNQLLAQERCAVPQILEERQNKYPELSTEKFEKWIAFNSQLQKLSTRNSKSNLVQVPVVIHIIHNGEPVGVGGNLLKSRIDRQLETLNEDFNRMNADAVETLDQFKEFAASFEIEFVYARQDPDGFETDGIVRIPGSQSSYSLDERAVLSAESYWPAEDYLNIWVADLSQESLGWAEFPVSNLAGLSSASNNRLIDGVTIDYAYFGDNPSSPSFESKGRTATHEMGHFFGLRHIWGDGGCSVDDYCEDTPSASRASLGCNLSKTTCESLDMVQNFMDYTNDACMNIFTLDQKTRVRTVLQNSPRRESLMNSPGLEAPPVYNRDLGLAEMNRQFTGSCSGNFTPQITVKNQGLFPINDYEIQLFLNGELIEERTVNEDLNSGETKDIYFSLLNFAEFGEYEISYNVNLNGSFADERLENNQRIEYYQKLAQANLPYKKEFNQIQPWLIRNKDKEETWQIYDVGLGVPFFNNRQNFGETEEIISPIFDFTTIEIPELSFVFAQAADSIPNRISIYASYDCGRTFDDLIFTNAITDLTTAYKVDSIFTPQFRLDWDTVTVDLNRIRNEESVVFNIVAENRLANNFYISEFNLRESDRAQKEISILNWEDVNPLFCDEKIEGQLRVKNTGWETISSFEIQVLEDGIIIDQFLINDEILTVGQTKEIDLSLNSPDKNAGEFEIKAITSNGVIINADVFYLPFEENCLEELPPLRLSFGDSQDDNWFNFNPNLEQGWTYSNIEMAVNSNSSDITEEGSEDWLISPLMDVSNTNYLGLIFDIAYTKAYRQSETFEIYISEDDGRNFNTLIYRKSGDSLATAFSNNENTELVWRNEFIDLSPYVFRDKIRLAFKALHDNGQNIYVRNITFFVGQSPPPAYPDTRKPFVIYPNPAQNDLNLHLNLEIAEEGFFQILDMRGNVILEFREPKILNQFITFDVSRLVEGMYILRLNTNRINAAERFIILK